MIIYKCDICLEEIKNSEEGGFLKIRERITEFLKHKANQQLRETDYLFCVDCARKIRDCKKKLEEENKNAGD